LEKLEGDIEGSAGDEDESVLWLRPGERDEGEGERKCKRRGIETLSIEREGRKR